MAEKCSWCKVNEGSSFYITGAWVCASCKKEAEDKHDKIYQELKNELEYKKKEKRAIRLDKFW